MGAHMVVAAALTLVTMAAMLFQCGDAAYRVPKGKWALPMDNYGIGKWVNENAPFKNYTLYFEYNNKAYNVAKVDSANYGKCTVGQYTDQLHLRRTGNDEFQLDVGFNYFICTIGDYCKRGMKMKITAIAA